MKIGGGAAGKHQVKKAVMPKVKKALTYLVIAVIALLCALNYELFVFPNRFAPAGLNGICTMIQHVTGISVGYLSLLINIPLAAVVYFRVSKSLAMRSMVYVVVFSVGLLILDHVDLSQFAYATSNGTSTILGPLVAGVIYGVCYSLLVRVSTFSGGTDFVAAIIHKHHPEKSIFWLIFLLNASVALISYFVYDYKMEPVILCILYSFTSSTVTQQLRKSGRSAIRFEIITSHPQEIAKAIITNLHHSATLLQGKGMYLGQETAVLICIVDKIQAVKLAAIIRQYPHTFAAVSQVGEVVGNFKHFTVDGREAKELLDPGDAQDD